MAGVTIDELSPEQKARAGPVDIGPCGFREYRVYSKGL